MRQDKFGTIAVDEISDVACEKCAHNGGYDACIYCVNNNADNEYYINKETAK